jgi:putative alpha-1,2-mannosidase
VREIMLTQYSNQPDGLCGNDDCGQMSAWYVFSALGFYPVNPGSGIYVIGTPLVRQATIELDPRFHSGRTFTLLAPKVSRQNCHVKSATLNGKPLERPWLTHQEIVNGGTLKFEMSRQPDNNWRANYLQ